MPGHVLQWGRNPARRSGAGCIDLQERGAVFLRDEEAAIWHGGDGFCVGAEMERRGVVVKRAVIERADILFVFGTGGLQRQAGETVAGRGAKRQAADEARGVAFDLQLHDLGTELRLRHELGFGGAIGLERREAVVVDCRGRKDVGAAIGDGKHPARRIICAAREARTQAERQLHRLPWKRDFTDGDVGPAQPLDANGHGTRTCRRS